MKNALMILIIVWASILTPSVYGQWVQAHGTTSLFNGFYFVDSLNGWFTHMGEDKIIHTTDGGYTFQVQQVTAGDYDKNSVYMENLNVGWCAGNGPSGGPGRIHRTTNGGTTWTLISHSAPNNSGWNAIDQVGNEIWFAGGYGTDQAIIMKTSNSGQSWQVSLYPDFGPIGDIEVLDEQNILISGAKAIHRTTDGGATWIEVTQNSDPYYAFCGLVFVNSNLAYSLGENAYQTPTTTDLYRTTDSGFTWNLYYTWPGQGQKLALSVIPSTGTIFVGGWLSESAPYLFGIIKSTDAGATWNTVMLNDFAPTHIYTPDSRHGWSTVGPDIYRYDYVTPPTIEPIPDATTNLNEPWSYQVQATGLGLRYSLYDQPPGLNIGFHTGLISGTPTQSGIFNVTVAVKDTDINVVNTSFQLRVNSRCIFVPPFPLIEVYVDSLYQVQLFAEDDDNDTLSFSALQKPNFLELISNPPSPNYTATLQGTPAITDTGYHNISIMVSDGYGGADTLIWTLQVIEFIPPVNHPPVFIGNWSDTVYVFRDSSYLWNFDFQDIDGDTLWTIAENIGVPGMNTELNIGIGAITLTVTGIPADTGKYSAVVQVRDEHDSIGAVQFIVVVDIITAIDDVSSLPSEFVLYQNYPNSFNPSTKIKYSIPELSFVTLKIYDVLGNEITTLVNEEKTVGTYEVNWNAANLPSGVYFYELQAGPFFETKKMILLK